MKLLVTGGAGFIGSNFVQYILEKYRDYQVVNLDALTYAASPDNLNEVRDNPGHRFVHGRIEDGDLVDKLVPGIDVIVNFAAESHVDRSIVEPQLRPNSPYSASKTAADLLVWAYHRTYDLPVVISRCSNNYGPRQHPEKFIPTVILSALHDKPVPIYGDGLYVRDWIHVLDHCRAVRFQDGLAHTVEYYSNAGQRR